MTTFGFFSTRTRPDTPMRFRDESADVGVGVAASAEMGSG
jgi:hypothetical protein